MQKNSPLLQHANYTILAGAFPQGKSECGGCREQSHGVRVRQGILTSKGEEGQK